LAIGRGGNGIWGETEGGFQSEGDNTKANQDGTSWTNADYAGIEEAEYVVVVEACGWIDEEGDGVNRTYRIRF